MVTRAKPHAGENTFAGVADIAVVASEARRTVDFAARWMVLPGCVCMVAVRSKPPMDATYLALNRINLLEGTF